MKIVSPMPTGNGAYIIHSQLHKHIPGYELIGYNPLWEMMPLALPFLIDTGDAEIIHSTPDYAFLFSKQKIPVVISFQNYVLDTYMRPFSTRLQAIHYATDLRLFNRLAMKKNAAITAVSQFTADLAKRDLGIKDDIRIIYNGTDTEMFRPKSKPKDNAKVIKVLFSGNPTRRKGAQWLEAIAEGLDDRIEIFVTGGLRDGCLRPDNKKIKPIGKIEYKDMPDLYNQVDLLLFPTVREGLSVAVLEAMACGLPVVASDCSSLPEQIIENMGGHLCPVGDTGGFAKKINELAASPSKRIEMGDFNRARVEEKFTLDLMIKGYSELFQEVLCS